MKRPVLEGLLAASSRHGAAHLVLVDPDRTSPDRARDLARECEEAAADAVLFGSSTPLERDPAPVIRAIRAGFGGPVVLFPGSADQVRDDVDAVLFLSLLSGRDARFLIGEQVAAAPRVLAAGVEPIATAYLLVGNETGGSVARVTGTSPLPVEPAAVAAHVQAAACLGFALAYLEAGSGAAAHLPPSLVRRAAAAAPIPIVVGGGVRTPDEAAALAEAGARFVVTGTIHERGHAVRPFTEAVHVHAAAAR